MEITFTNGDKLNLTDKQYWQHGGILHKRLGDIGTISYMRMGSYSLSIGNKDIGIYYEERENDDPTEGFTKHEYLLSFSKDRARQMEEVKKALAGFNHPFTKDVLNAIRQEQLGWKKALA